MLQQETRLLLPSQSSLIGPAVLRNDSNRKAQRLCKMLYQPYRSLLALLVVLFFYNGSTEPDVQVTGTWEAGFSGKVQGKGTSQDDMLVLELTQDGSAVKGTLRFKGLETAFPIVGKVRGRTFSYSTKA